MDDARSILARQGKVVQQALQELLASQTSAPAKLIEAISYSLLDGGKRLRPTLTLESFAACKQGARGEGQGASEESALAAACAIELIHCFSLVHDDLPAMDDDDLRRGKPTCHKVFGEAMAILAGDAMVALAFDVLSRRAAQPLAGPLVAELAAATGAAGMIGGQVLDMAGENQTLSLDQLQQVHRLKTGALLTCSCRLGAIAAGATESQLHSLTQFGRHLGLAFQIVDDLLDVTSTPEQLGKATHKDTGRGKNTYPALLGPEQSRTEADRQLVLAIDSLAGFDSHADALRTLARFVGERKT
ncbi:MAG TPA: farnesyl diphosphate synthase [Tepidisphaeraceae bacterium]|nr:farnesyl diphosphate synthase [Tepidisphaeraceae bacterium]